MTPEREWQAVWWDRCDDDPMSLLGCYERPEHVGRWGRFVAETCADVVRMLGGRADLARRIAAGEPPAAVGASDPDGGIHHLFAGPADDLGHWVLRAELATRDLDGAYEWVDYLLGALTGYVHVAAGRGMAVGEAARHETARRCSLIRCLFPNPFRPVTFDPDWRTSTVVALARTMYDARDFAHMPVLADALDDAGCTEEQVIAHCCGPGPHVRGCWVVDLVLGNA